MPAYADTPQSSSDGPAKIPQHVAIIMDGNGRWAEQQGLPRLEGHRVGVDCLRNVVEMLADKGVKHLTVYAFSTENWNRPAEEVDGILDILSDAIRSQTQDLHENNVRIKVIGKASELSESLQRDVAFAQELTKDNSRITLNVAFNYGGREEILEAVRSVLRDGLQPEDLDEEVFSRYLYTAHCPDPDLIIRTGGEFRTSNFLLWQSAYSEYYYTPTLWPDLDTAELEQVLEAFSQRQRRFGRVSPQD